MILPVMLNHHIIIIWRNNLRAFGLKLKEIELGLTHFSRDQFLKENILFFRPCPSCSIDSVKKLSNFDISNFVLNLSLFWNLRCAKFNFPNNLLFSFFLKDPRVNLQRLWFFNIYILPWFWKEWPLSLRVISEGYFKIRLNIDGFLLSKINHGIVFLKNLH